MQRPGAMALQGHDAQQIVGRIADVPALPRMLAVGNPPQAEEAHHVIDPQSAGVPQRGPDRLDERLVGGRAEPGGGKRRQLPVLAVGIEGVGRGADDHLLGQQVLPLPGVRAAGIHADRQVLQRWGSPARPRSIADPSSHCSQA